MDTILIHLREILHAEISRAWAGAAGNRGPTGNKPGGLARANPAPLCEGVALDLALRFTAGGHRFFALDLDVRTPRESQSWDTVFKR